MAAGVGSAGSAVVPILARRCRPPRAGLRRMIFDEARPGRRPEHHGHRGRDGIALRHRHEPADAAGNRRHHALAVGRKGLRARRVRQLVQIAHRAQRAAPAGPQWAPGFVTPEGHLVATSSRQPGGAQARAPRPRLRHGRRPQGASLPSWPSTCATTSRCSRRETPARAASTRWRCAQPSARWLGRAHRSLGNPLDVGFAVMETLTAALVKRSFYRDLLRRRAHRAA